MTPDQGRAFLQALGATNIQKAGKWVSAACPLARYRHTSGRDTNPSFGLTVEPDKPSRYNCFACGTGTALALLQALEFYGQGDPPTARAILDAEELEVQPLPEYGEFSVAEEQWVFRPWPEQWLLKFEPLVDDAWAYLLGRGVTPEQAAAHRLLYDTERQMVVFQLRDAYGTLAGARGRSIINGTSGGDRHHDYSHKATPKNVRGVWYNEQALQLPGPTLVVEGQFDLLRVEPVWPKAVANLTAKPTSEKMLKLCSSPKVILIPDNDSTGEDSVGMYSQFLNTWQVPFEVLELPPEVKDPGECSAEYLQDRLAYLNT